MRSVDVLAELSQCSYIGIDGSLLTLNKCYLNTQIAPVLGNFAVNFDFTIKFLNLVYLVVLTG